MPRSRLRRYLAPATLFAGLLLFGISLLVLGGSTTDKPAIDLRPSYLDVVNGTGVLVYPTHYFGFQQTHVEVTYAFPQAVGNAYFVGCDDTDRAMAGQNVTQPILAFRGLKEGGFVADQQTVGFPYQIIAYGKRPILPSSTCEGASVVLTWAAPSGDPAANRPNVTAKFVDLQLDSGAAVGLLILSVGGAVLALVGGLAWARDRAPPVGPDSVDDSTAEALRRALDSMGAQLERTRRHLLFAGVLGVFLWYPFLVPWAWHAAQSASSQWWVPWALSGAALLFLLVLTLLWAREFIRLDREVAKWRRRMDELRAREAGLMASLEGG